MKNGFIKQIEIVTQHLAMLLNTPKHYIRFVHIKVTRARFGHEHGKNPNYP